MVGVFAQRLIVSSHECPEQSLAVYLQVTQCRYLEFSFCSAFNFPWISAMQNLAPLASLYSQLQLLSLGRPLGSAWVPPPFAEVWKLCLGSGLGKLFIYLFSIRDHCLFLPVSSVLVALLHTFLSDA